MISTPRGSAERIVLDLQPGRCRTARSYRRHTRGRELCRLGARHKATATTVPGRLPNDESRDRCNDQVGWSRSQTCGAAHHLTPPQRIAPSAHSDHGRRMPGLGKNRESPAQSAQIGRLTGYWCGRLAMQAGAVTNRLGAASSQAMANCSLGESSPGSTSRLTQTPCRPDSAGLSVLTYVLSVEALDLTARGEVWSRPLGFASSSPTGSTMERRC